MGDDTAFPISSVLPQTSDEEENAHEFGRPVAQVKHRMRKKPILVNKNFNPDGLDVDY